MQNKFTYWGFPKALSSENCDKILNLGLQNIKKSQELGVSTTAVTFGNNHKGGENAGHLPLATKTIEQLSQEANLDKNELNKITYKRDSEVTWLNDKWIYDLIFPFVYQANSLAGWNYDIDWGETLQFTVYEKDMFYGWHFDGESCHYSKYKRHIPGVSPEIDKQNKNKYAAYPEMVNKVRKLSLTLNLTDPNDYEGGNLMFDYGPHHVGDRYHICEDIRPRGSIIIFPSYIYHQVTPVTKGTRYSLVMWSLGYPFK